MLGRHAHNEGMHRHTTLDLDDELVRQAAEVLGTQGAGPTVRAALEEVVRRRKRMRLLDITTDLTLEKLGELRSTRFGGTQP